MNAQLLNSICKEMEKLTPLQDNPSKVHFTQVFQSKKLSQTSLIVILGLTNTVKDKITKIFPFDDSAIY